MSDKKKKERSCAGKAVSAYNDTDSRFDPLGSYTGKCRDGAPEQDADDL